MKKRYTFTERDKEQIKEAVAALEQESCGEIVPYFVQSSDDYPEASWYLASMLSAFGLILVAVLSYLWALPFSITLMESSIGILALLVLGYILPLLIPSLKRLLISNEILMHRVHQRASMAFLNEGIFETEERVGILIFVSRLEHKVIVLGDKGINAKVKKEDWHEIVGIIAQSIKSGKIAEGYITAINKCKTLLLTNGFVRKSSDYNELSDDLRIES